MVVSLSDQGKSARQIALDLGVGKTQIQNILKRKAEVLEALAAGAPATRVRKLRRTGYERINEFTLQWIKTARSINTPLSGRAIQERALAFAAEMGIQEFKASNGWLESFRRRNGIRFSCRQGESADVNELLTLTVEEWKDRLPALCASYRPSDVFNVDETGLFYRALPDKSHALKGEKCEGGKKAKERVTIALCCSLTGEKIKPVVIGESQGTQCFRGVTQSCLPVTWRANRKAWMTSALFEEWILELDKKMGKMGRKILLFLDNASCHRDVQLMNIKLQFLPAIPRSCPQPLGEGITRTLKAYYRKKFVHHVLSRIDEVSTASEVSRCVNVLHAVNWIAQAWEDVSPSTILGCFQKAGFLHTDVMPQDPLQVEEDSQLLALEELRQICPENVEDFIAMDDDLATFDTLGDEWDNELFSQAKGCPSSTDRNDGDYDTDDAPAQPAIQSYEQVTQVLEDLTEYCLRKDDGGLLTMLMKVQTVVDERRVQCLRDAEQLTLSLVTTLV